MAKFDFDVAVAFAAQSGETYDPTLDAISATLSGDPDGTDDGLLLGDPESGIGESGLSLTYAPDRRDKGVVAGSFTRPLSDWLKLQVPTFSFSFPFCGNRGTTTATPVDADFTPLTGVDAILQGAGMVGTAAAGTGWIYNFGAAEKFSSLVYFFGNRLELQSCQCSSLSIEFTPGSIPVATAEIVVGSVKDPTDDSFAAVSLPTLDYGAQASVSAPVIESVGHSWQNSKGFQSLTLTITPATELVPDSNEPNGETSEQTGRESTIEATLFADDADQVHELKQAFATSAGDLDALSFTVGTAASGSDPALAFSVLALQPELVDGTPDKLGSKAGNQVNLILRGATANSELSLNFI